MAHITVTSPSSNNLQSLQTNVTIGHKITGVAPDMADVSGVREKMKTTSHKSTVRGHTAGYRVTFVAVNKLSIIFTLTRSDLEL